jgi:vacuolar-type H+-ATPase subunit H
MVAEKSVLQQIRDKELLLSIKIDETRREAEDIIRIARKEASELIEKSELEGKTAAREYYEKEIKKLQEEIEQLKNQGSQQAMSIRANGEKNVLSATEKIVKVILLE